MTSAHLRIAIREDDSDNVWEFARRPGALGNPKDALALIDFVDRTWKSHPRGRKLRRIAEHFLEEWDLVKEDPALFLLRGGDQTRPAIADGGDREPKFATPEKASKTDEGAEGDVVKEPPRAPLRRARSMSICERPSARRKIDFSRDDDPEPTPFDP